MKKHDPVEIYGEYITISQFLKKLQFVQSGGDVKNFIHEHAIIVNDVIDDRRGKKLYRGDRIEIGRFGTYVII